MLHLQELTEYVEEHIGHFHNKRLQKLDLLNIEQILKRKNPYLYKVKNILTAQDLVKHLLDAFLQSQEETLFGDFMEGVAIFVCQRTFNGTKSRRLEGIDLEFEKNGIVYVVEIKSGPNWGNSSQIKQMQTNFEKARFILKQERKEVEIIAVNGCCYGIDKKPNKGTYYKYCGQQFWEFISDNPNLYIEIIEPLGYKAREKNDTFLLSYAKVINKFTFEFSKNFCNDGMIDWEKIIKFKVVPHIK